MEEQSPYALSSRNPHLENDDNKKNILPGGSMFEISMLVLFDTMIMPLAEEKSVATNTYFARHANLE